MFRALSDEQGFLVEAARDALGRVATLEAARAALDGGPAPDLWPLACEAGWAGLLVAEDAGGAALSAAEATLVLEECGRRLADARLLGHLPATALLGAAPDAGGGLLGQLADGTRRAALVDPAVGGRGGRLTLRRDGAVARATGHVPGVLDAPGADVLVLVGEDEEGLPAAGVVAAEAGGVALDAVAGYDATRAVGDVALDDLEVRVLDLAPARARDGADLQRLLLAAESVGAASAALELARDYAVDRVAFGRPIGSYQAIKHKLVEMLRRTEGARSVVIAAARQWDEERERFALTANAARVTAADALGFCALESIFVHGGVGATWEHDASLTYRRAEHARRLAGGTTAAADAVAQALFALVPAADRTTTPREVSGQHVRS